MTSWVTVFQVHLHWDYAAAWIGAGLLEQARQLFPLWHRVRDGTLTREECAAAVVTIRAAAQQWLAEGAANASMLGRTATVAEAAVKGGVKGVVLFSGIAMYWPTEGHMLNEVFSVYPNTYYVQKN